jgi:hypothetical protein
VNTRERYRLLQQNAACRNLVIEIGVDMMEMLLRKQIGGPISSDWWGLGLNIQVQGLSSRPETLVVPVDFGVGL